MAVAIRDFRRSHHPAEGMWLALSIVPVVLFIWNSLYYSPWTVDDAFISFRYARNLVDGHGLVYNTGEPVEGFSNFSWVLLAAALMRLGLPFLTVLKGIGLASGVAILLMASLLARRLGDDAGGRFRGTVVLWYLGFNTSLAVWCQSGLETTLFSALIVGMCLRYEIEVDSSRRLPWSAVLFALAWMTRPEAPLYGLYFLARRATVPRRPDRFDLWWIVSFATLVIPYEAWGYWYYGHLFPQTYATKIGTWSWTRFGNLKRYFAGQGWGYAGLLLLAMAGLVRRRMALPPVLWAPIVSGLAFMVYAGRDWMPRFRFAVPILALQGCLVALGIEALISRSRSRRVLTVVAAAAVLLAGTDYIQEQMTGDYRFGKGPRFPSESRRWSWWKEVPANLGTRTWPLETNAWVILAHTDPGERIVIRDIGFPGFLSMNSVWDQGGLVTPVAAEFRHGHDIPEVRDRFIKEFIETGAASYIFVPKITGPAMAEAMAGLDHLLETDPTLRNMFRWVDPDSIGNHRPNRPQRIFLGLPLGTSRVWKLATLPESSKQEILVNLENRLPHVLARFPEYAARASEIMRELRQFVSTSPAAIETGGSAEVPDPVPGRIPALGPPTSPEMQ